MSRFAQRIRRAQNYTGTVITPPPVYNAHGTEVLADAPQIYYAMQEQNGTVANDSSGFGNNGTYQGNVTVDHAWNPYQFAPVALGRHINCYFDGNNNTDYVQLPANAINVTNGFTFEAWVYPNAWGWQTHLFSFGDDIALVHGYNDPSFEVWVGGTSFTVPACSDYAWHHVVVTVAAGGGTNSAKVYYDGSQAGAGTVGALVQKQRAELYLGRTIGTSNTYYSGYMTQVAVYGSVLTPTRVQAHYMAGVADADPVWHGTAEWYDTTYFNQFTGATVLANPYYVPTADWMPPEVYNAADVATMQPYFDISLFPPATSDYSWYRTNGAYIMPGVSGIQGTLGTETIGYTVDDEPDMYGEEGLTRLTDNLSLVPAGYMAYANFGIFITLGQGSPALTQGQFTNAPGLKLESADLYWYALRNDNESSVADSWGIPNNQIRRACNYGAVVERARSTFDVPRPQWGFVELSHPATELTRGGPNPNQVEGAVWSNIIGGARGIIWFHHSFAPGDPPAWSAAASYVEGDCVMHGGEYYYAALPPAVGETPALSSYTWVRWSGNSGAGLNNTSVRHPDLPARLIKIKADLQTMAPAINSPTTPHLLHRDLYSTYRPNAHDGKKYIIALPGLNAPNGGTFTMYLPAGQNPASIEVVGESRTITPSAGTFTDTFAAEYTHHIYRWT